MTVIINGTTGITTPGLTNDGSQTITGGTANGVAYLNGSKVLTTGSDLAFTSTGLGIGTGSPSVKLDLVSSSADVSRFTGGGGGTYTSYLRNSYPTYSNSQAYNLDYEFYNGSTVVSTARIQTFREASSVSTSMRFFTTPDAGTVTERMRITSSGNLLIGSVTESANLYLYKSSGDVVYAQHNANTILRLVSSGGANYIQTGTANTPGSAAPLIITTMSATSEWARFTTGGDFCVGTTANTNPAARVQVGFEGGGTKYGIALRPAANGTQAISLLNASGTTVGYVGIEAGSAVFNTGSTQLVYEGVKFNSAQQASGDANTLDDYEEGNWTPTARSNCTINSVSSGYYTKVGRQVTAYCYVNITTTSGNFAIQGLPFTSQGYGFVNGYYQVNSVGGAYIESGQAYANISASTTVTNAGGMFYFSYFVS